MADRPKNARYTKDHEWVRVEGTTATVGITDFAVTQLGDLVFVELPAKGSKLTKGQKLADIESVKAVAEVYAPVGGEVVESNVGLANDQGPMSSDPFGKGWIAKLKVAAGTKVDDLMDAAAYQAFLDAGGGAH